MDRRTFLGSTAATLAWGGTAGLGADRFSFRYVLASCMYGRMELERILPEVRRSGADAIDIWPEPHGNQREQIERMGRERFLELLAEQRVRCAILTHFDLGPFGLQPAMKDAQQLGAELLICHSRGPRGLRGDDLKRQVRRFARAMRPHVEAAEAHGVVIGIENHSASLIDSPDALRLLVEQIDSDHLGVALAPYHLPQEADAIGRLVEDLAGRIVHFYAWQHGDGSTTEQPLEKQLRQLPGRGPLDFRPIVAALRRIGYGGWTQIFMHPFPRGIPIRETAAETTREINRARDHLEACLHEA